MCSRCGKRYRLVRLERDRLRRLFFEGTTLPPIASRGPCVQPPVFTPLGDLEKSITKVGRISPRTGIAGPRVHPLVFIRGFAFEKSITIVGRISPRTTIAAARGFARFFAMIHSGKTLKIPVPPSSKWTWLAISWNSYNPARGNGTSVVRIANSCTFNCVPPVNAKQHSPSFPRAVLNLAS